VPTHRVSELSAGTGPYHTAELPDSVHKTNRLETKTPDPSHTMNKHALEVVVENEQGAVFPEQENRVPVKKSNSM